MKAKYLTILILLFFASNVFGQKEVWLQSNNHPYVFTQTVDYYFAAKDGIDTAFHDYRNQHYRLKTDPEVVSGYDAWLEDEEWIWDVVWQHLQAGRLTASRTDNKEELSPEALFDYIVIKDTALICFASYEEANTLNIIHNYPEIMGWRLHLEGAWNAKQQQLEQHLVAISPVFRARNDIGVMVFPHVPVRLSVGESIPSGDLSINDPQWAWVGQAKIISSWEDIEMLKGGTASDFIREVFFQGALIEKTFPLFESELNGRAGKQLLEQEIELIHCQTDTLIVFDGGPNFETVEKTLVFCLEPADIPNHLLHFRLYFDPSSGRFAYQPLSMEILVDYLDENGNFLYYLPIYLLQLN